MADRVARKVQPVEVAQPILERLTEAVEWPSVLTVPRLGHKRRIEINASRACFNRIKPGPMGFRVNMLRSASGRASLACC